MVAIVARSLFFQCCVGYVLVTGACRTRRRHFYLGDIRNVVRSESFRVYISHRSASATPDKFPKHFRCRQSSAGGSVVSYCRLGFRPCVVLITDNKTFGVDSADPPLQRPIESTSTQATTYSCHYYRLPAPTRLHFLTTTHSPRLLLSSRAPSGLRHLRHHPRSASR